MTLSQWIEQKKLIAFELFEEAEKGREESEYTNIDALEQSVYNDAVLDTLIALENFIHKERISED